MSEAKPLTPDEIEAMRARCDKATPSPEKMAYDAGCTDADKSRSTADDFADGVRAERERTAHAREDVPRLLAEVERLRSLIDEAVARYLEWCAEGGEKRRTAIVTAVIKMHPNAGDPGMQKVLAYLERKEP